MGFALAANIRFANADSYSYANGDTHPNSATTNPDTHFHEDTYPHRNTYTYTYAYSNAHSDSACWFSSGLQFQRREWNDGKRCVW